MSRSRGRTSRFEGDDVHRALDAMTADELRSLVLDALRRLDADASLEFTDLIVRHATKGSAGWAPPGPSPEIADDVRRFAEDACEVGEADPDDVCDYLRQGRTAFLAGDHPTARAIFSALLPPIGNGDLYLGQDELVSEVLTVNEHECATQYLVSVYLTTPLAGRAEALGRALTEMYGVGWFRNPIEEMEGVATASIPELEAFLPLWAEYLAAEPPSSGEWEGNRDRWRREAVLRVEGPGGLERIARESRKPETLGAWCRELADRGDWSAALDACGVAVEIVGDSHWRGDFLDQAALAARELGRRDAEEYLERAWRGAPSLARLLRWLGAGASRALVDHRAAEALEQCPEEAHRQLGLLHLVRGDGRGAAVLLATAPGLGWSYEEHPGHLLFGAFARLLAGEGGAGVAAKLAERLDEERGIRFPKLDLDDEPVKPGLSTPSVAEVLGIAELTPPADPVEGRILLEAMRVAADRRVEGILGHKRRNYYDHAATLVACCVELAGCVGEEATVSAWVEELRREYSRFYAFRRELDAALRSAAR